MKVLQILLKALKSMRSTRQDTRNMKDKGQEAVLCPIIKILKKRRCGTEIAFKE